MGIQGGGISDGIDGVTLKSLAALLHNCGLTELKQEPAQFKLKEPRDMRITGIKP